MFIGSSEQLMVPVHSPSRVFATPRIAARQAPWSYVISWSWLRFRSVLIVGLLFPFPRWQNWGTKLLSHQPRVTVLGCVRLWLTLAQHRNLPPSEGMPLVWPGSGNLDLFCTCPCGRLSMHPVPAWYDISLLRKWALEGRNWVFFMSAFLYIFHTAWHISRDLKNNHLIENNSIKCIKHSSV